MSASTHFVGGRPPTDSGKNRILWWKVSYSVLQIRVADTFLQKRNQSLLYKLSGCTYQCTLCTVYRNLSLRSHIHSLQQTDILLIKSSDKYLHCKQGTMFLLLDLALPALCYSATFTACLHKVSQTKVFPFLLSCRLGCLPAGREPSPGLKRGQTRRPRNSRLLTSAGYPQDSGLLPLSSPISPSPVPTSLGSGLPPSLSLQGKDPHCKVPKGKCYFRMSALGSNVCSIKAKNK